MINLTVTHYYENFVNGNCTVFKKEAQDIVDAVYIKYLSGQFLYLLEFRSCGTTLLQGMGLDGQRIIGYISCGIHSVKNIHV